MVLSENKKYEIIGKVESINYGAHFCNTTVLTEDGEHVNLKLEFEQMEELSVGKVYLFKTKAQYRTEDEIVLKTEEIIKIEEALENPRLEEVLKHFYVYAPISIEEMKTGIEGYLNNIESKILKTITKKIYDENKTMFYIHPAATKFHHAYVGGLAYHTYTMLKLIDPFVEVYPYLNKDLLYAGAILHDMSKITEISGVDGEYTKEGLLIGHLVQQAIIIDRIALELGYEDEEEVLLLKHMILSHHGQLHFGSPKKPQIGEALLLWYIDTIDSKFSVLGETLEETQEGTFTSLMQVLDKMRYYKSNKK